jgi:hypothetical protein
MDERKTLKMEKKNYRNKANYFYHLKWRNSIVPVERL